MFSKFQNLRFFGLYLYTTIIVIGVMLALAFGPALVARRYGYTWSLLIWLVPIIAILWWFLSNPEYEIDKKKACGWAVLYLFLNGIILDVFFAHHFFVFPNRDAVLGIYLPGFSVTEFRFVWERPFPVEELFFYVLGFTCILLIYVWGDEYWLRPYGFARDQSPDRKAARQRVNKLLGFHWQSLTFGIILMLISILIKALANPSPRYVLPAYLTLQIVLAFVPTVALLKTVGKYVNWRAFSFTLVTTLLISLLYEVTLGIPGMWWGYQTAPMVGLFVASWHDLPIEAVTLWFAAVFMTVLVFEAIKIFRLRRG